jgi:hypothetical protein
MRINYCLGDRSILVGWEHSHGFAAVSREEILWHFFPGDIEIRTNGGGIRTRFGWVPILHFGLSLVHICRMLLTAEKASSQYVFTEADESITFQRLGESLRLQASFDSATLACSVREFCRAVSEFVIRVVSEIGNDYPNFLETPLADEMATEARALAC